MEAVFTTVKPSIIDRIKGYFAMRRFNRKMRAGRAARLAVINEVINERVQL